MVAPLSQGFSMNLLGGSRLRLARHSDREPEEYDITAGCSFHTDKV